MICWFAGFYRLLYRTAPKEQTLKAELRLSKAQVDRALADVADLQAEPPNPNPYPYPNPTLNPEGTPQHGGGRGDPLQLL